MSQETQRLVVDQLDFHERGEPRARRSERYVIQPLPSGRRVWIAWEDGEMDPVSPVDALFIAFLVDAIEVESLGVRRQRLNTERREHSRIAWPPWSADELTMDYTSVWVYVPTDWDGGWVEVGKNAFWTEAGAQKEIFTRKAKRDAAG